ncbi:MAG TPA: response regulator [Rudaea sp.]
MNSSSKDERARNDPSELRDVIQLLEDLNEVGAEVAAELNLETAVQVVTDAATRLCRAAFGAFFYNVTRPDGEAYTLYTISGVPREAFSNFPMPRNTQIFAPTFRGEGIVRSDDITADPRYGKNDPYFGMPKGHLPVRSYLAVSVLSASGEVQGGLFFGHPEIGVFDARAERIAAAIAVHAGLAIDRAKLYRAAEEEIDRRKRVEAELRASEETLEAKVAKRTSELEVESEERRKIEGRFKLLVDGLLDYAIYMLDPDGIITNWNTGAERIKGYTASEVVGSHYRRFFTDADRAAQMPEKAMEIAARVGKFEAEGQRVRKDGTMFWASVLLDAIHDEQGQLIGYAKITRDVTERRQAALALQKTQEQLAQAQKMEGIGHLTGGVAHDFNNLLAIIMGNIETLQRSLDNPNADRERLKRSADSAMRGVQRAVALTQRLLAFSRQQPLDPKVVSLGRLVTGMADLLRRTLGEQVVIETVLAGGLWNVHVDPNQLEIAILNLAINARDAMPDGGSLNIETANAYLDEAYAHQQAEVLAGQYTVISVSDTGCGMPRDVLARVFEPFFTTKDAGHGTGLGLSQVYGFVKQSGGHVKIYSEVGEGTTVKIYLPRWHASDLPQDSAEPHVTALGGDASEIILVVEDEPEVRAHTVDMLRELGYRVFEADNGKTALQLLGQHSQIRLLFTDVGLPGGMNGRQLADEARRRHPDLKVLFTTGYARNAIVHHGRLDPGVQLLTKPFTYAALASKVRDMLDVAADRKGILLVDDEPMIRAAMVELLGGCGFAVQAVASAAEALDALKIHKDTIGAAIIDVGLPDRRGDELVAEVRAIYPSIPIVIASGSEDPELRRTFAGYPQLAVLTKPYGIDRLLEVLASMGVS